LIALFRLARFSVHLLYALLLALVFPYLSLSFRRHVLRRWSAGLLNIFNVHIEFEQTDSSYRLGHGLIVTNHISWLDVFVLNVVVPMRFVAKLEVKRWPVIGWLCTRAQTIFIERGSARSAARINVQLVELLQGGECLAVFPEGTTTDGAAVAHFHSSLLQPAIDAGAQVHPMAIRYQDKFGAHSTVPAYIDDVSFASSLWNIFITDELHVRLVATPVLAASGADRRSLTRMAEENISATLSAMHHSGKYRAQLSGDVTTA
jgi:1-acyl-sn-glycerol-3-phosphate acyltransferase